MRLLVALLLLMVAAIPMSMPAVAATTEGPADTLLKRQLVEQYVTEERYGPLYDKVIAQYAAFTPPSRAAQTAALVDNADFKGRIFTLVREQLISRFTLEELQAEQRFLMSPDGQSIEQKINDKGLSFRPSDLSNSERQALRDFNATPVGQSVAKKNTAFISQTLSQVFKTFLMYQANL